MLVINLLYSCAPYEWDGFENKEQVINAVKENINILNQLTKELYDKYGDSNKLSVSIENKFFKTFKESFEYKTKLSMYIFKNLRIDYIIINTNKKTLGYDVKYVVKNKFGTYIGFYFALDDNKNYEVWSINDIAEFKEDGVYLEFDDRTALFDSRHGWYTEKICDNWYFFEQDFDNLNFIKYIYDDINNMNPASKFYEKNWASFVRYNPYKQKKDIWSEYEKNGFNNKEEVIEAFKENANGLNRLTKEIREKFGNGCIIQNNSLETKENSIEYKTELSDELFLKLKIDYISVDSDNRIRYVVKNKFGYGDGFYYSLNDDKNYYIYNENILKLAKEDGYYLEFGDKTVLLGERYAWYTERISDKWYYYQENSNDYNIIKYIYDDIHNMNPPSKYFEKYKEKFDRYSSN